MTSEWQKFLDALMHTQKFQAIGRHCFWRLLALLVESILISKGYMCFSGFRMPLIREAMERALKWGVKPNRL